MTIDDYKRNLKGVNDGSDFSAEYLVSLPILHPRTALNSRSSKISTIQ